MLANLLLVLVTMLGALAVAQSGWTPRMFVVIPIGHIVNSLPLTPVDLEWERPPSTRYSISRTFAGERRRSFVLGSGWPWLA